MHKETYGRVLTGLGPSAVDSLLIEYGEADQRYQWLKRAFPFRTSSMAPDSSVAYQPSGISVGWLEREFSAIDWYSISQEFGTAPIPVVLGALVAENVWYHHADPWDLTAPSKKALKEAFCPNDPTWQATVLDRGVLTVLRGLHAVSLGR